MQIDKHAVVTIDYKVTDPDGELIDTSDGHEPLSYLHGTGGLVTGLENALVGKSEGDQLQVVVGPEEGYGQRDDRLIQQVPRSQFEGADDLVVGMPFQAMSDDGPVVVHVVDINDAEVTVDGNHPLAGTTLHFDVTVREVRAATEEEIEHGHPHGADGHEDHEDEEADEE